MKKVNKFKKIAFSVMATLCAFVFCACSPLGPLDWLIDEFGNTIFEELYPDSAELLDSINSAKVIYRPVDYNYNKDIFRGISNDILNNLSLKYGMNTDINFNEDISDKTTTIIRFNSIAYQITYHEVDDNLKVSVDRDKKWKWSVDLPPNLDYFQETPDSQSYDDLIDCYKRNISDFIEFYEANFVEKYVKNLQVVIYEIVLGKQPTVFTSSDTEEIIFNKLNALKAEYKRRGSYVGLTNDDINSLNNYILSEIIGSDLVNADTLNYNNINYRNYENYIRGDGNTRSLIETIKAASGTLVEPTLDSETPADPEVPVDPAEQVDLLTPYPASYISDRSSSSFYMNEGSNPLGHVPSMEYQSLILMPEVASTNKLQSVWIALESINDISVRVGVNYYQKNGTVITTDYGIQQIKAGTWNWDDGWFVELDAKTADNKDTTYEIDAFNNNIGSGVLNTHSTNTEAKVKQISAQATSYFNRVDSSNGVGAYATLNSAKFAENDGCGYYEIFFDIQKDPNALLTFSYEFKVALFLLNFDE